MRCIVCHRRRPTRDVFFQMNIGMVVARMTYVHEGPTCSGCIHGTYWKYTLTTLAIGWLGIISLLIAPFIILANTFVYCTCWIGRAHEDEDEQEDY